MILVTERNHLATALSNLAGIVDTKNTIPIMSSVLLSTAPDGLKIRVTNGDMEASELIPAHIGEQGSCTVPAATLRDFARNIPEGAQISMKLGERLAVSSGRSRINLATLPTSMFPAPWSERWTTEFEIDGAVLSHLLSRVEFAQEKDVSRTYLMGVRMETKRMISTNGACLVYVDNDAIPQMDGVTIPTRMVAEMSRMTTLGPAVKVGISDSKISLTSDNSTVISKLLDKSLGYPDYIRVIPKEPPSRGTVKTVALVSAIRRAMISATEGKARTVRLGFSTGGISVTARNSISDAMDEIDAEFIGEDVTLPFDPDLMISILNSIPSDTAEFRVGPVKTATTWKALGGEDGVLVAMPQRVGT